MAALCVLLATLAAGALIWGWRERCAGRRCVEEQRALAQQESTGLRQSALETEEHLTAILSSMEEGVMVVDSEHVIRLANPSVQRLFALKTPPVGQTVLSALRLPSLESLIEEAIACALPQQAELAVPVIPGGAPMHLIASAVPLHGTAGVIGGIAVFRDVSRLRKLEEMRREFVSNVSHELRTPLSIFQGNLENLLDQPEFDATEVRSVLQTMRKHSLRLNALVEDLLTLTRLEARRDPLKREPILLPAFIGDLLADWQPKVAAKRLTLTADLSGALPPLHADPFRLHQVLDNLLDNALKHSGEEGAITLRAEVFDESRLELRVSDTGSGIPPADLPHIFERFYRADKARSRELGGTGLGLSIVKHIMSAHGGTVSAESVWGRGTTVILSFPVEPEHPAAEAPAKAPEKEGAAAVPAA